MDVLKAETKNLDATELSIEAVEDQHHEDTSSRFTDVHR